MAGFCRLLSCSRPRPDDFWSGEMIPQAATQQVANEFQVGVGNKDGDAMKEGMQAMLKHIEVRWQLFNEVLCKFRDLDAMLAICTDDVSWVNSKGAVTVGRNMEVAKQLQLLITHKLSVHVEIESITLVTNTGSLDLTLDKNGSCGRLQGQELFKASSSLRLLFQNRQRKSPFFFKGEPLMLLEKDKYELKNEENEIVERGNRVILWEEHNDIWYVCGILKHPH